MSESCERAGHFNVPYWRHNSAPTQTSRVHPPTTTSHVIVNLGQKEGLFTSLHRTSSLHETLWIGLFCSYITDSVTACSFEILMDTFNHSPVTPSLLHLTNIHPQNFRPSQLESDEELKARRKDKDVLKIFSDPFLACRQLNCLCMYQNPLHHLSNLNKFQPRLTFSMICSAQWQKLMKTWIEDNCRKQQGTAPA